MANEAGIEYVGTSVDGVAIGTTTGKIGFFAKAPVVKQTLGAAAIAIDPEVSTSTLVASLHSIAISAASLANANRLVLANLGLGS